MGVTDRVAVIRNKLQPLRLLVDGCIESACLELNGAEPDHETATALAALHDADLALQQIVTELDELYREAGGYVLPRHGEPAFIPSPESKL